MDKASIVLHAYDGVRQPFPSIRKWSATTLDGRSASGGQKQISFPNLMGPVQALPVPFFDNFGDLYTVRASARGFEDSAWYPVHVNGNVPVTLELMFLPKGGTAHFANASWEKLNQARPVVARIIQRGCGDAGTAAVMYGQAIEARPGALACFLNILTALADMRLRCGESPLRYYWNISWPPGDPKDKKWLRDLDAVFQQDRFFCYVDDAILPDIRASVGHGFSKEPLPQAWGHTGATESYKETQFDVGNVQLTFHGRDRTTFTDENNKRISCVKIEADIDFYKDVAAHAVLEVIPNWITGGKTDPRVAYALRWMAAKREGLAEFDPLYTVEAQGAVRKAEAAAGVSA